MYIHCSFLQSLMLLMCGVCHRRGGGWRRGGRGRVGYSGIFLPHPTVSGTLHTFQFAVGSFIKSA